MDEYVPNMFDSFTGLVAVLLIFGSPVILVASILYYRLRKLRLTHEITFKLAEKGVAITPALLVPPVAPKSDLRHGLVLFLIGIGLGVFLYSIDKPWTLGVIPALAGLGYLISWKLERTSAPNAPASPVDRG